MSVGVIAIVYSQECVVDGDDIGIEDDDNDNDDDDGDTSAEKNQRCR